MSAGVDSPGTATGPKQQVRPDPPRRSPFAIGLAVFFVVMTAVTIWATEFSFAGIVEDLQRPNSSMRGLANIDLTIITGQRTFDLFVETLRMAAIGTIVGSTLSLPLALWNSPVGAPGPKRRWAAKTYADVIRAIPDVLWALLFVAFVGVGILPGLLALVFFTTAVVTKLTSDVLDGIDRDPIEAANASGATHTQMLRTAIVPQILPAYSSFALYALELNLRASVVLGLVGAGGIGQLIEVNRSLGRWPQVWGVIVLFFVVVFFVERLSVSLRRRLV